MTRAERGGVYIAVLGVTLFVTLIGLSAMLLVETERETRDAVSEARIARTDARSAVEIALSRVAADDAWRTNLRSGVWTDSETLGETKWGYMLEYDEGAGADESVEATITVGARRNESARFYSIDAVIPPSKGVTSSNIISNPDFDSGTDPWTRVLCTIAPDATNPHSGRASMLVSDRMTPAISMPSINVVGKIMDGETYDVSLWVFLPDGVSEAITVGMTSISMDAWFAVSFTSAVVPGGAWTRVTGTLTPDWANDANPSAISFYAGPASTKTNYWIDDVELRQRGVDVALTPIEIVSGSFRQRVIE